MKMASDERRLNIRAMQLVSHEPRRRAPPDCVLNIHDRCHQRDETKIRLNHRQKGTDPSAVTCSKHTELFAPALAQCRHQLPRLDYPLTQPLCVANEIGSDRELTVPIATRYP